MGKLVLGRKVGETVSICEGAIVVKVEGYKGSKVLLSFEGDKDLKVMRGELAAKEANKVPT